MAYRSTPIASTGVSPAELIMGRRIRTPLPTLDKTLCPRWPDLNIVRSRDEETKERYRFYYDEHNAVCPLLRLKEGQRVMTKLDNENLGRDTGIIKSFDPDLRTCIMETPRGTIRRNRRHIKVASSAPTSAFRSPTTADLTDTFLDNPNNSPPMVVENPNCDQARESIMPQTGIQPVTVH